MWKTLASFWGKEKLDFRLVQPCEYAHLVIDVQRQFCDPLYAGGYGTRETNRITQNIANLAPVFRKAGMPTYMIFCQKSNEPPEKAFGGFHRVQPEPSDILQGKTTQSAFEYTTLASKLHAAGTKTLLVSGFHTSVCINATVQDALRENFNVWVLSDCIANGKNTPQQEPYRKLMLDNGAELMTSKQAILRLQQTCHP